MKLKAGSMIPPVYSTYKKTANVDLFHLSDHGCTCPSVKLGDPVASLFDKRFPSMMNRNTASLIIMFKSPN